MLSGVILQRKVIIKDTARCCGNNQFDTNYPNELRGIIHPHEFDQSMYNINLSRRRTLFELIVDILSMLFVLVGFILLITGIALIWTFNTAVIITSIILGTVLLLVRYSIMKVIKTALINPAREDRLVKAIDAEAMKYSTRSTSTRWRLNLTIINDTVASRSHLSNPIPRIYYSIIIDIGSKHYSKIRSNGINSNRNQHQPISYIDQQYPILPSLYPNLLLTRSHDKSFFNQGQLYIHSSV